jgi:flagellar biosynthetic protein FliR
MTDLVALAAPYRETFLLVLLRVTGMLLAAPVLGHRSIPVPHRVGLSVLLALVLTPVLGPASRHGFDALALAIAAAGEVLVGVTIGFVASLTVWAVQAAGELVGFQMGLGISTVYDPATGDQVTTFTRFIEVQALLLFLAVNGHHLAIQAVAGSFTRLAPGAVVAPAGIGAGVVVLGGKLFRSGLELAAPLVGVLFVINVVLALLARVAPQMNVFAVGAPLTIAAGLYGLVETFPYLFGVVGRLIGELGADLHTVFGGAARGF